MAQINGKLPDGWEARFDPRVNKYYYLNHQTKETTWEDPRISSPIQGGLVMNSNAVQQGTSSSSVTSNEPQQANIKPSGSSIAGQSIQNLPEGWEARFDPRVNKYYYLNHQTKETTWEAPKQPSTHQMIHPIPVMQETSSQVSGNLTPSVIASDFRQEETPSSGSNMDKNAGQQSTSLYASPTGLDTNIQNSNNQGQSTVLQDAKLFLQKSKEIQLKSSATIQKGNPSLPDSKTSGHSSKSFTENLDNNKEMKVQLGLEFPGLSQKEIDSALMSTSYNLNRTRMLLNIMNKKTKKPIAPTKTSVEIPEGSGTNFDILKARSSNSAETINVNNNVSEKNTDLSSKAKKASQNSVINKYKKNKENMETVTTALIKDKHDLATLKAKKSQKNIVNEIPVAIPSTSSQSERIRGNTLTEENKPKVATSRHSIIQTTAISTDNSKIYPKEPSLSDQSHSVYNSSVSSTILQETPIEPNKASLQQRKEYSPSKSSYKPVKSSYVFQSSAKGHNKALRHGHNKDLASFFLPLDDFDKLLKLYSKPNLSKGPDKNLCKGPSSFTLGHDPLLCKGPMSLQKKQVK